MSFIQPPHGGRCPVSSGIPVILIVYRSLAVVTVQPRGSARPAYPPSPPEMLRRRSHLSAGRGTAAAHLGTGPHPRVVAHALAVLGARLTHLGTDGTRLPVEV